MFRIVKEKTKHYQNVKIICSYCWRSCWDALLAIIILLLWLCKKGFTIFSKQNSDTGSSDPCPVVELNRGSGSTSTALALHGQVRAAQFTFQELQQATKEFNQSNIGSFGLVFKGILADGTVVAIKWHRGVPRHEFISEVEYLSSVRQRNVVSLLGYCQEMESQMLVYEYVPNGSMCNHLYDTEKAAIKLEFKQRICIALGAAKGLRHLHSLIARLVHENFKTANVMVDEDFIAKVADAGISSLLRKICDAGPSHPPFNAYQDPEVGESDMFSESSDIYSFGVFLLELVTGRQASKIDSLRSHSNFIEWAKTCLSSNEFVDHRLTGSFTDDGIGDVIRLTLHCLRYPGKERPKMEIVVQELERILDKERELTTVMGEGTTTVTLGSELFTS